MTTKVKKEYRYIVLDTQNKWFCIKESTINPVEYEKLGYTVLDRTDTELYGRDIDVLEDKGYEYDTCGDFLSGILLD